MSSSLFAKNTLSLWLSMALLTLILIMLPASAKSVNEDGLHQQDWFLQQSFLELKDDWQEAQRAGRGLAIVWELKGCPACQRMHDEYFSQPELVASLTQHFDVLQLNFIGSRTVTDFDGQTYSEAELAEKYAVQGTPSWLFFPAAQDDNGLVQEGLRISGLPKVQDFIQKIELAVKRRTTRRQTQP